MVTGTGFYEGLEHPFCRQARTFSIGRAASESRDSGLPAPALPRRLRRRGGRQPVPGGGAGFRGARAGTQHRGQLDEVADGAQQTRKLSILARLHLEALQIYGIEESGRALVTECPAAGREQLTRERA